MKKLIFLSFILCISIFMLAYKTTLALFTDSATSTGNSFAAASIFPTPSITPTVTPGPGSVVINELMWAGSASNSADEWIELRNTTSSPISLIGWMVNGAGSGSNQIATISAGIIPANGFFLISHFSETSASSILNVSPDILFPSMALTNSGEQLVLERDDSTVIDTANVPPDWFAGNSGIPDKSMERNSTPGSGTSSGNWHTATTQENLDAGMTELATPKAANSL